MFDILSLAYTAAMVIAQPVSVKLEIATPPALAQVVQVSARRPWLASDSDCTYAGVAVPYERLWEERDTNAYVDNIRPPEPGKIAGYVVVFNTKTCKGQPAQKVRFTGDITRLERSMIKGMDVFDVTKMPVDVRPPWYAQAVQTIAVAGVAGYEDPAAE